MCFAEQLHINLHWTQYVSYLLSCNLTEDEARNQSHEKKEADVLIRSAKRHTSENQSTIARCYIGENESVFELPKK